MDEESGKTISLHTLNNILQRAMAISGNADHVTGAQSAVRYIQLCIEETLKKTSNDV